MTVSQRRKQLVRFYIDFLNFYYGVAKPCGFRWVDMRSLFLELVQQVAPDSEIEKMFLFTSIMRGEAGLRQETYLNALTEEYGDCLEVMKGHMMKKKVGGMPTYEEKQTDVNLACQMVHDAHTAAGKEFDIACLVSNDSDFVYPLMLKRQLKQRTLLIYPRDPINGTPPSGMLKKYVNKKDRVYSIPKKLLIQHRLQDPVGKWHSPNEPGW